MGGERGAGVAHAGAGGEHDAVSGATHAAGELQAVAEGAERGVASSQVLPHLSLHEHAGGAHGQDVGDAVVLSLVDLAGDDRLESAARAGGGDADLEQHAGVPAHLLGADYGDGAAAVGHFPQFRQAGGVGGGVVVEDPPAAGRREHGGRPRFGGCAPDRIPQGAGAGDVDEDGTRGQFQVVQRRTASVDDDDGIGGEGLVGEGLEGVGQGGGEPPGDDQGRDPGAGRGHTAMRRRRRRSRSDSPPQMPKRSSWISAYSRHSARTVHDWHTDLASLVDPPFSGKKASGSVWAHRACCCQASGPSIRANSSTSEASDQVSGPSPRMFHTFVSSQWPGRYV